MSLKKILLFSFLYYAVTIVFSFNNANSALNIKFFDVEQGDSILITTKSGYTVLVDGGGNYEIDRYLNNLNRQNICKINLLFLTHPHADHYVGLTRLLDHCQIDDIRINDIVYEDESYKSFFEKIRKNNVKNVYTGDNFIVDGVAFKVLWPDEKKIQSLLDNVNNVSTVLEIEYNDFKILLTGDIETDCMSYIDATEVDILKVPHHGSKGSINTDFYNLVSPTYCIISSGLGNSFGHPHKETLDFLAEINCVILRTDELGTIEFSIN